MNANLDLERRLADFYATEAPLRAPERVLESVLVTSEITRQRRAVYRPPWRFRTMNSYAKVATAAVAVIAIGAVGLAVSRPGSSPDVGGQVVTPSPEPSPSPSPSATSRPTPSPSFAPPLTQSFTSTLHGFTMSYPEGWTTQAATEPWTGEVPLFRAPPGDFLYDTYRTGNLFLILASQPIGDSTPGEWAAEKLEWAAENLPNKACATPEAITVDGATGLIGADDCHVAAVTIDGRGYIILLYTSPDEPSLSATYDRAWFEEVLATVQLQPEDAVDAAP